ncbi:astacin-like metalloendopeptidase [Chelmon rostratus]|uniref:astacin-like metalloendopeptidase n=1 Tax=Chelmon rostratus TaxID=109905 RepID=UPI001BECDC6C|nr:astacin-like metalloendopeptidase [Chelmon rostratus]
MLHLLLTALLFVESLKDVESSPIQEAKTAQPDDWFSRLLKYMNSNPETLEELLNKKYAVWEGDMILSTDRNAVESTWPTLEIPYIISPELESRTDDILSAMAMVSEHTCVSFHKRASETNYLHFKSSKGCASYVGFIGGEQPVFVASQCIVGNIVHEILHALGFHHEHTRTDREQYITILTSNIITGMERNFKKRQGQTFNLGYDIGSIMHYGSGFFSANGLPTIVPLKDVKDMGQRVKMTKMDTERVRHLYNCGASGKEIKIEGSGEKEEDVLRYEDHVSASKPEDHKPTAASPSA